MSYTMLRLTDRGIALCEGHLARLGAVTGPRRQCVAAWARGAARGIWALTFQPDAHAIMATPRGASRLVPGLPVRWVPSPLAGGLGAVAKPPPPSPYDGLRVQGLATLLTSPDGTEVWESCSAAVLAWDGTALVVPPEDRSRVASLAESALWNTGLVVRAPIARDGTWPLALVNAVKGPCPLAVPGRAPWPHAVTAWAEHALDAATRWP